VGIIETEKVTKIYRTIYGSVTAIDDVSLNIGAGITGVLGPNGSGKTTFLRAILGLLKFSGNIKIFDFIPPDYPKGLIGYLPQKNSIWLSLKLVQPSMQRISNFFKLL